MKKSTGTAGRTRKLMAFAAAVTLAGALGNAQAQNVRIVYRPLTPSEIATYGMTNTTQKSGGAHNAAIGTPIYMECLVQSTGAQPVAVNWTLMTSPPGSVATLQPSPLPTNMPTYDGGDKVNLSVASRTMLKPDVVSSYDFGNSKLYEYKIRTDVVFTNKTLSYTNLAYGSQYMGHKNSICVLCHADKQTNFDATAHAGAFTRAITGESTDHFSQNCFSCHVLGYDTTAGATNGGFDDIATSIGWTFPGTFSATNWTGMNTNLQSRANVQCENCHGGASAHMLSLGGTNAIDVSLSAGTCGVCHDAMPRHVKAYEWGESKHSTGYVFRFSGSCMPCHSSKGFIETWDPYYLSTNKVPRGTEQEGITCTACHDPHTPGMGKQLRAITTATLSNGYVVSYAQAGEGVLCINCHHARVSAEVVVANTNSTSLSPHHGTQGDLLLGQNAIEYGLNMPQSRHLLAVTNSCVGCHMQLIAGTSYSNLNTKVGGHTFRLIWNNNTTNTADDIEVTEVCSVCHVEEGTFDFGGEDYDRDGAVEGVQTEIRGLLNQLELLLPPAGTGVTVTLSYTMSQRKAYYNYAYILEDKSLGVHNPKYAAAILQASIDDLNGGIDIDRDGLVDSWELLKFGSLTSQTGSGDADGDGLSNAAEQGAGTNPNLADSDVDGISDLAELQAGTNPLDINSTIATNAITMLPAIELGYQPGSAGVTQRFEAINAVNGSGGWTNVGSSFISSNSWSYQLMSLRDSTQKFFRVVKP